MDNKVCAISALAIVANTLQGLKGFVANAQGLGVQVEKPYVAAARTALQDTRGKINAANRRLAGTHMYEIQGFPTGTAAGTVSALLSTTEDEAKWKPWHVIPVKHIAQAASSTWNVKADVDPSHYRNFRVILANGTKLLVTKLPSPSELREAQLKKKTNEAEQDKARRRQAILSREANAAVKEPDAFDPWRNYQPSVKGTNKGRE